MMSLGPTLHRLVGILAAILLFLVLLYASRFWIWEAPWDEEGLFGLELFGPQGDLFTAWLSETPYAPFAILVWAIAAILLLSAIQWLASKVSR